MSSELFSEMPPCVIFEDDDILVVNKPPGLNTHSPAPYKGEGIFEWLRDREPRWSSISIVHRLDKDTSGVMVFPKSDQARKSLTLQFEERRIEKTYLFEITQREAVIPKVVRSRILRSGENYIEGPNGEEAETFFVKVGENLIEARPKTGRTHQIRVHAAAKGFPIKGDILYGGSPSTRLHLHSASLKFEHPGNQQLVEFKAPANLTMPAYLQLRQGIINDKQTTAYRIIHGASDGWPKFYLERLGDFQLAQSENADFLNDEEPFAKENLYFKRLDKKVRLASKDQTSPQFMAGIPAEGEFKVVENKIKYLLSFNEGYSYGLFLDQRDNRRRILENYISSSFGELSASAATALNVFAYTCGFSVCAARAGFTTTSLDLSKKYLEWGKRNFLANDLDPNVHDFIFGDAFDWLARFKKKNRLFDAIFLDPPTFSQSKEGIFRVEKDYAALVKAALAVLKAPGVLFCSTNAADLSSEDFVDMVRGTTEANRRKILKWHFAPQPPDFPVSRQEPAYLKTLWLRVG